VLTPYRFDELFLVSPSDLPTGNTKLVIDKLFIRHKQLCEIADMEVSVCSLEQYKDEILEILRDIDLHQSLVDDKPKEGVIEKTGDQKRLDKIIADQTRNYWSFLIQSEGKDVIDQSTYDYCFKASQVIQEDKDIASKLGLDVTPFDTHKEVHNEEYLEASLKEYKFGIKGYIDNVVIDHDKKSITLNDFKTTTKELVKFPDSIEYYQYWLQIAIYTMLVSVKYKTLIEQRYTLDVNLIVIDQNYLLYPFKVSEQTLEKWVDRTLEVFKRVNYHYENKKYGLPYELCTGSVIL
jgi:hypothetical protein